MADPVEQTRIIQLTRGQFAVVDDIDFEYLNQWNWYALKAKHGFYAVRSGPRPSPKSRQTMILMHRIVLARKLGIDSSAIEETDHKDGCKLNNTRANLTNCTPAQNLQRFRTKSKNSKSKYFGVHWNTSDERWQARIIVNGKTYYGGQYKTEIEAAQVRDEIALRLLGDNAFLNFELCQTQ